MDKGKRPLTEKDVYKKALKRKTRYRAVRFSPAVIIMIVIIAVVIAVGGIVFLTRDRTAPLPVTGTESGIPGTSGSLYGTEQVTTAEQGVKLILTAEDVYRGDLVLVNADHEFRFPDERGDVSVYDNKSSSYKVGDLEVTLSMTAISAFNVLMDDFYAETGCRDVMIVSGGGYRSEEYQRQLYADRVATQGVEMAARYVALPGNSEHHTGLAMDLSVYTAAGEGYAVRTYDKCAWLVDNFENYGFIMRYPEDKENITGIGFESWHYRYVGAPHSLIMKEENLCFEEYIELLQTLPEGKALSWDGVSAEEISLEEAQGDYIIYYVPASDDGNTEIVIPEGREYTVSGDNVGGFIITLMGGQTK